MVGINIVQGSLGQTQTLLGAQRPSQEQLCGSGQTQSLVIWYLYSTELGDALLSWLVGEPEGLLREELIVFKVNPYHS